MFFSKTCIRLTKLKVEKYQHCATFTWQILLHRRAWLNLKRKMIILFHLGVFRRALFEFGRRALRFWYSNYSRFFDALLLNFEIWKRAFPFSHLLRVFRRALFEFGKRALRFWPYLGYVDADVTRNEGNSAIASISFISREICCLFSWKIQLYSPV